jgi:hypothetical protein
MARYGTSFYNSGIRYNESENQNTRKKGRRMAGNGVPTDPDDLLGLGEDIADGLDTLEVAVGVKQNTAAVMRAAMAAYRTADQQVGIAKGNKGAKSDAVAIADDDARIFLLAARKVLALHLGETWSAAWEPTGFPNQSTAVPTKQEARMNLCASLKAYFTAVPAHESAPFGVTAAIADTKYTALSDARDANDAAKSAVTDKNAALEGAYKNLRKRTRGLIDELGTLLEDDDARWHEFGLSRPADPDTPEIVEELVLTANLPGKVMASWARAPRSSRYRVFVQVVTVDVDFVNRVTVHDPETMLDGLPSGLTLKVYVVSANEAGEAAASETKTIVIP